MSLTVYLTKPGVTGVSGPYIFIREDGQTKSISQEEWERRWPDRKPVVVEIPSDNEEVYSSNITHNLTKMAKVAGIYQYLWCPEELDITKAEQLIEPLRLGLERLEANPEVFREHNPSNGWGNYESLVDFTKGYLQACREYPDAEVNVSRWDRIPEPE